MCGLTGYSGKNPFNVDRIKELMLCNMSRGVDATGIYSNKDVLKLAVNAMDFLATNRIDPEQRFLGHCRAGTFGAKTDAKNAHPFHYGDTILMHNGTLKGMHEIAPIVGWTYKDWDVDSQIIAKAVSMNKQIELFKKMEGAAALIWAKENDGSTIYCYRNDERPLFRGVVEGEGMYFSSLESSLNIIGCSDIKEVKIHCIYKITDGVVESTTPIVIPKKKVYDYSKNNKTNTTNYATYLFKDQWIQCVTSIPGFTLNKWYRVYQDTNGMFVDLLDDNYKMVIRNSEFFRETSKGFFVGNFIKIEEVLTQDSPCKRGDILYCKSINKSEKIVHAVHLNDSKSVLEIPVRFCRPCEADEEVVALAKLKKHLTDNMMDDVKKRDEATTLIELAENMYVKAGEATVKLTEVLEDINTIAENLEDNRSSRSPYVDLVSDLFDVSVKVESVTKWIADSAIAVDFPESDK